MIIELIDIINGKVMVNGKRRDVRFYKVDLFRRRLG